MELSSIRSYQAAADCVRCLVHVMGPAIDVASESAPPSDPSRLSSKLAEAVSARRDPIFEPGLDPHLRTQSMAPVYIAYDTLLVHLVSRCPLSDSIRQSPCASWARRPRLPSRTSVTFWQRCGGGDATRGTRFCCPGFSHPP